MRSRTAFLATAASICCLLLCVVSGCQSRTPPAESAGVTLPITQGEVFPGFSEPDFLTGKPVELREFQGKVVLVDFWATWCKPCVEEIPNLKRAYEKYHDKGFEVVSVSLDKERDLDRCRQMIHDKGMSWYHIADGKFMNAKLAKRHGIHAIPVAVVIGPDGKVISRDARGAALHLAIEAGLRAAGKPVSADEFEPAARAALEQADKLRADGQLDGALRLYQDVAAQFPSQPSGQAAKEQAGKLRQQQDSAESRPTTAPGA